MNRAWWRQIWLAGVLVAFLVPALVWLALPAGGRARRWLAVGLWRVLLRGLGVKVALRGAEPLRQPGTLYVANHVTWLDIPVLGRVLDAGFVAKGEVGRWPVVGPLARAYGCLFVEREARGRAGAQAAALGGHLAGKAGMVLFPEGTTSLGQGLLPFRSSLFAPLIGAQAGFMVQPVALVYTRAGAPLSAQEQRAVAWIEEDALLPNALGLIAMASRSGPLEAQLWFCDPVGASDRKALARACEAAVAERLACFYADQAATEKREA